jgi:hypothetical protein
MTMKGQIKLGQYDRTTRYFLNDIEVSQEEYEAAFPSKLDELLGGGVECLPSQTPSCWPMVSRALAVHPAQVEEANARNKRMGSTVRYDQKGNAHLPDRGARRDLLRVEGYHDNSAGYGD